MNQDNEFLETVAGYRCPCGHLKVAHREPENIPGSVMGSCYYCECKGLIDWKDDEDG